MATKEIAYTAPFIFNDSWFYTAKQYVLNTITEDEWKLYRNGKIRVVYESFEHLLLDNIQYYDRFIRTILWLYENKLIVNGKLIDTISKRPFKIPMTATVFYYIVLMPLDATIEELYLAFPSLKEHIGTTFVELFKPLSKINAFKMNLAYCKGYFGSKKYIEHLKLDITPSSYVKQILNSISEDVVPITKSGLEKSLKNILHTTALNSEIFSILANELNPSKNEYCIVKPSKITLFDQEAEYEIKFSEGKVIRQSVKNWQKCFKFDKICSKYLEDIYRWFNNAIISYDIDLVQLMNLIVVAYNKNAIAIQKSANSKTWSKCTFKKCWSWWRIVETTYFENVKIAENVWHTNEDNIGKVLYKNGYYVVCNIENEEWLTNLVNLDNVEQIMNIYKIWLDKFDHSRQALLTKFRYNRQQIINTLQYIYK